MQPLTIDGNGFVDGGVMMMVGDTKCLVWWMVENDNMIMHALWRGERLVHPVRHDRTGIYIVLPLLVVRAALVQAISPFLCHRNHHPQQMVEVGPYKIMQTPCTIGQVSPA